MVVSIKVKYYYLKYNLSPYLKLIIVTAEHKNYSLLELEHHAKQKIPFQFSSSTKRILFIIKTIQIQPLLQ